MSKMLVRAAFAGVVGGVAMIPAGLLLRRGLGYSVNVYGELLVRTLLGRSSIGALVAEHFLISWCMALPLVLLSGWICRRMPLSVGAIYGAAIWLLVNSLLLPAVFGRPTPWTLGWSAIWPSLTVHVVYGMAANAVGCRLARGSDPAGNDAGTPILG